MLFAVAARISAATYYHMCIPPDISFRLARFLLMTTHVLVFACYIYLHFSVCRAPGVHSEHYSESF